MPSNPLSLEFKIKQPRIKREENPPAIIFLHGRGADENDLIGLAEYLDDRFLFISVRAPFPWIFSGGYTWFEIEDLGKPDVSMFEKSYNKLVHFINEIPDQVHLDKNKIILCGFSMGAMMAYSVALSEPDQIFGVIALSGLVPEGNMQYKWVKVAGKPFFIGHGIHDSVIPVSYARRSKEILIKANANVTYREYDMDHQISEETLADVVKWSTKLINTAKRNNDDLHI